MLTRAKTLLNQEFNKCYNTVNASKYYSDFAKEKIRHSLQVLGAGNYILKHENCFANESNESIEIIKTAILLHDVARFDEITALFYNPNQTLDHGVIGCDKLKTIKEYDNILLTLPTKHHGHLIEDYYLDDEYLTIKDKALQEQVTKIIFVVRDADKIANLHLITSDRTYLTPLFVPDIKDDTKSLSVDVIKDFYQHHTINRNFVKTQADCMMQYIAWLFDVNYKSSIEFCYKLKVIDRLFAYLDEFSLNKELNQILKIELENHLKDKFVL